MSIKHAYIFKKQETKICRLCGSDNKENIDIFSSKPLSSRCDDLLTKILTVYPLVLYKDDPLPHHICPKCIGNVSTTYQDIQQVMRQQSKWMSLTKAVEPEHNYFRILNVVENSTKATKESIKSSYDIEINHIPLRKFLSIPHRGNINNTTFNTNSKLNVNENVVKNIQTKLESNGFTIKHIKIPPLADEKQNLNIINSNDVADNSLALTKDIVACSYCKQKFSNLKILAQHQLTHLKLTANKIFQKRLLPKQLRRGRLITINNMKNIRCLNCWRIYKDNNSILKHWSCGECEFYCFVCGKEFANSPKMLREHIPTAHGISYRTAIREFSTCQYGHITQLISAESTIKNPFNQYQNSKNVKTNVVKKSPRSCMKNDDGTITCKICHKVFTNFRSSNSHMRKHKPTIRYGDSAFTPNIAIDIYNTHDDYTTQPSTSSFNYENANTSPFFTKGSTHPSITKSYPLRGIKTKFTQKRHGVSSTQKFITSDISDDSDLIVPEVMPTIKSEQLIENENKNNDSDSLGYDEYSRSSLEPVVKSEPFDGFELDESQRSRLCFICNESFSTNRDYKLHTMFVHNIN